MTKQPNKNEAQEPPRPVASATPEATAAEPQPEVAAELELPQCGGCERKLTADDVDLEHEFCTVCMGEQNAAADEVAAEEAATPVDAPRPLPEPVEAAMRAFGLRRDHVHPGTELRDGFKPGWNITKKQLGTIVTLILVGGKRVRMITMPSGQVAYMGVKTTFTYPDQSKKNAITTYNDVAWVKANTTGYIAKDDHGRGRIVMPEPGVPLRAESVALLVHDRDRGVTVDPPAESKSYRAQ